MGKIPNKIIYGFLPRRPLDLISLSFLPKTYITQANAVDVISFTFANQKAYYDRKHQTFFMKVGNWAMLKLYKDYSILSLTGVIKKLT